ncbi:MAG: anaerobic ribonucleoside-triphosphate reductase activating protein [Bacteroidales bacterium]|nr:anaerobic ribonucleoside-triphosphate reductase activating protein [Bacteroidales bacterium]
MLKFINYDIVFQEIPGETTLAINLSNCPNRCKGCHSPYLMEDKGVILDENILTALLGKYGQAITCVCFMGGDAAPEEVQRLAIFTRKTTHGRLKTAWYSGKQDFPAQCSPLNFDYVKLGPYIEGLGGLDSPKTNQRLYFIENGKMTDISYNFRKKAMNI